MIMLFTTKINYSMTPDTKDLITKTNSLIMRNRFEQACTQISINHVFNTNQYTLRFHDDRNPEIISPAERLARLKTEEYQLLSQLKYQENLQLRFSWLIGVMRFGWVKKHISPPQNKFYKRLKDKA